MYAPTQQNNSYDQANPSADNDFNKPFSSNLIQNKDNLNFESSHFHQTQNQAVEENIDLKN